MPTQRLQWKKQWKLPLCSSFIFLLTWIRLGLYTWGRFEFGDRWAFCKSRTSKTIASGFILAETFSPTQSDTSYATLLHPPCIYRFPESRSVQSAANISGIIVHYLQTFYCRKRALMPSWNSFCLWYPVLSWVYQTLVD